MGLSQQISPVIRNFLLSHPLSNFFLGLCSLKQSGNTLVPKGAPTVAIGYNHNPPYLAHRAVCPPPHLFASHHALGTSPRDQFRPVADDVVGGRACVVDGRARSAVGTSQWPGALEAVILSLRFDGQSGTMRVIPES